MESREADVKEQQRQEAQAVEARGAELEAVEAQLLEKKQQLTSLAADLAGRCRP